MSTIIIGDLRAGTHRSARVLLRQIALEFGPAELLDSLLIRPTALYIGITMIPNLAFGIIAGQTAANLCFYVPTIISYELLSARARIGAWNSLTDQTDRKSSGARAHRVAQVIRKPLVEVWTQVPDYRKRKGRQHRWLTLVSLIAAAMASAQHTPLGGVWGGFASPNDSLWWL